MAGAVTDTYAYDAFGNLIAQAGTTPNDFRYRGEQYDATLGLQYLRARYYNPATGRFLSKDPYSGDISDPKSLHKYSYARANPISGRDPSGWSDDEEEATIFDSIVNGTKAAVKKVGQAVVCALAQQAAVLFVVDLELKAGTSELAANVTGQLVGAIVFTECGAEAEPEPEVEPPPGEPGNPGEPEPPNEEPPNPDCSVSPMANPKFYPENLHHDSWDPISNPDGLYRVPATGSYQGDKASLLEQIGIVEADADGFDAHHVSYNPETNEMAMQLVDKEIHRAKEFAHRGGVPEYEKATGCKYRWP